MIPQAPASGFRLLLVMFAYIALLLGSENLGFLSRQRHYGGSLFIRAPRLTKPKITFFLHLHKSGGTTLCRMAERNHLKSRYGGRNCLVQEDQRCCGGSDSLQAQVNFAQTSPFQFVASEGDLYESLAPAHYQYVVVLRQSRDRYWSQYRHVLASLSASSPETMESFEEWYSRQPDNWNTRKICGTRCQSVPKFQLTARHFQYTASRLLDHFEILLLEDFNRSYMEFARRHGWIVEAPLHEDPILLPSQYTGNATTLSAVHLSPDDRWNPMMSRLDDVLYKIAVAHIDRQADGSPWVMGRTRETNSLLERFQLDLAEYYEYRRLVRHNCSNPCCADECSQYRRP